MIAGHDNRRLIPRIDFYRRGVYGDHRYCQQISYSFGLPLQYSYLSDRRSVFRAFAEADERGRMAVRREAVQMSETCRESPVSGEKNGTDSPGGKQGPLIEAEAVSLCLTTEGAASERYPFQNQAGNPVLSHGSQRMRKRVR